MGGFSQQTLTLQLLIIPCLFILSSSSSPSSSSSRVGFDFFYFVQQWPGSYCDTRRSCCYPTTGKPAEDFSIHGLWPNYNSGKWPRDCDRENPLDKSQISDILDQMQRDWPTLACPTSDGIKFWDHEWEKHGTCTSLDQYAYFKAVLDLKRKANLLQHLVNAGIHPKNLNFYNLNAIKEAIKKGVGHEPYIECNVDTEGNHQLYQVYLCVDTAASNFIDCPIFPHGRGCGSKIEFPSFASDSSSRDEF